MKMKFVYTVLILLFWAGISSAATAVADSFEDYTTEEKVKIARIILSGGAAGDVLTLQPDGTIIFVTPAGGTGAMYESEYNTAGTPGVVDQAAVITNQGTLATMNAPPVDDGILYGMLNQVWTQITSAIDWTQPNQGTIDPTNYVDNDTVLSDEQVQDKAGAMVSGNTETGISVTYQDDDGTFDFVVTEGDPIFSTWLSTTPPIYSLSGAVLTDQTTPQTIGATGARLAMCWITDMTCSNPINGSVTGNAGTVTNGVYTTGAGTIYLAPAGDGSALTGVLHSEVDGSTTNEINTVTGDNATTTAGLAITVAGAGTVSTAVSGDTLTITGTAEGWSGDPTLSTDLSYYGKVISVTAGDTLAFGNVLYYKKADEEYYKAAETSTNVQIVEAICVGSGTDGNAVNVLVAGYVRNNSWAWTIDDSITNLWKSGTAGAVTETLPTTSGNWAQVIGTIRTADILYFNPQLMQIKIP